MLIFKIFVFKNATKNMLSWELIIKIRITTTIIKITIIIINIIKIIIIKIIITIKIIFVIIIIIIIIRKINQVSKNIPIEKYVVSFM